MDGLYFVVVVALCLLSVGVGLYMSFMVVLIAAVVGCVAWLYG